jgi:hypothetical protein
MRDRIGRILSGALLAQLGACSGLPGGPAQSSPAEAVAPSSTEEPNSTDGGASAPGVHASSAPPDSSVSSASDTVPSTSPADGSANPDGSSTTADASLQDGAAGESSAAAGSLAYGSGGDGGQQPYKGTANPPCSDIAVLGASWWYNWTTNPGSCNTSFAPMIWGHVGNEQTPAGIASAISSIASAGRKVVLGFNEPDNAGQSNISVATAISLWPSFDNTSVRIGSPATQGNTAGLTWIQNFMSQINANTRGDLRVDFIATHWYGWNVGSCDAGATNLESWIKQIEAIPGNRPIWLTEWGCLNQSNPTAAVVQAFFSGAIAMFARHPRLERHAWYPFITNNELSNGGALTSLGMAFAAAPAYK